MSDDTQPEDSLNVRLAAIVELLENHADDLSRDELAQSLLTARNVTRESILNVAGGANVETYLDALEWVVAIKLGHAFAPEWDTPGGVRDD